MRMSYDRIGNWRIRDRVREDGKFVRRKRSIFLKVAEVKQELKRMIPEVRDRELLGILSRCRNFYHGVLHYGRRGTLENRKRKRELTANEQLVYQYLITKGLNPGTTYRWFLATRLPQDLREQLAKGRVSQKLAMKLWANRRRTKNSTLGLILMEEIRTIIQKLDWR